MFNWLKKKNKDQHSEECLLNHKVTDNKFEMVSTNKKLSLNEISSLLKALTEDGGSLGFYVVSKCGHGVKHNNRILLWWASDNKVEIELQRPQDLCLCASYYKSVKHSDFELTLKDFSKVISQPDKNDFRFEEWT